MKCCKIEVKAVHWTPIITKHWARHETVNNQSIIKIQQTITNDNKLLNMKNYHILASRARLDRHNHTAVPRPILYLGLQTGRALSDSLPLSSSLLNYLSVNHPEHQSRTWRSFQNLLHQYYGKKKLNMKFWSAENLIKNRESNENICIFTQSQGCAITKFNQKTDKVSKGPTEGFQEHCSLYICIWCSKVNVWYLFSNYWCWETPGIKICNKVKLYNVALSFLELWKTAGHAGKNG